jgi:hypothetical protein
MAHRRQAITFGHAAKMAELAEVRGRLLLKPLLHLICREKGPNEGPEVVNEGPEGVNKGPEGVSEGSNEGPVGLNKELKEGPLKLIKGPNEGPKGPNEGPKGPNEGPKGPNEGPKGPNEGPKGPKEAPELCPWDPRSRFQKSWHVLCEKLCEECPHVSLPGHRFEVSVSHLLGSAVRMTPSDARKLPPVQGPLFMQDPSRISEP